MNNSDATSLEHCSKQPVSCTPGLAIDGSIVEDVITHVDPKLNISHPQDDFHTYVSKNLHGHLGISSGNES